MRKHLVEYKPLNEVLSLSDIVTIHMPLTDETRDLIDKDKLALIKDSSFLINTAVGPIVDNAALAEALHEGVIAGAGLDRVDMVRRAEITFNNIVKWEKNEQENIVL